MEVLLAMRVKVTLETRVEVLLGKRRKLRLRCWQNPHVGYGGVVFGGVDKSCAE